MDNDVEIPDITLKPLMQRWNPCCHVEIPVITLKSLVITLKSLL